MTAKIYPYLTFENAREAMHYYVEQFGAEIIYRQPLSAEQAENLGLALDDLDTTTARTENRLCRCNDGQSPDFFADFPAFGFWR